MIKILRNNIELDIVTSTLTLTSKNTAFSTSFSLEYSENPFLILENSNTIKALGSPHILSLNKQKEYEVTVFRDNKVYYGKLKVLHYIGGARKCDLVFGSEILKILNKPISSFMPTVYLGDTIPYAETSSVDIPQEPIIEALLVHEKKTYPDVSFQFPEILATGFYDKEEKSKWLNYNGYLNRRGKLSFPLFFEGVIVESDYMLGNFVKYVSEYNRVPQNYNTFNPCVFLLSILDYSLNSINFKGTGEFFTSLLTNNIIIPSKLNNNTFYKTPFNALFLTIKDNFHTENRVFSNNPVESRVWKKSLSYFDVGVFRISYLLKDIPSNAIVFGSYKFEIKILLENGDAILLKEKHEVFNDASPITTHGSVDFEVNTKNIKGEIEIYFAHNIPPGDPVSSIFSIGVKEQEKEYSFFHPTVDLSRHVPDWTVGELLNNCKSLFNLKIDIDDSLKTISMDFIDEYLNNTEMVDLRNYKLEVKNYKNSQSDVFKITYANNDFVNIDKHGVSKRFVAEKDRVEINNGFMTLSFNGKHHELKKDNLDDGVVLLLNNPGTKNTIDEIDNQTLELTGEKGIGSMRWRDWVRFRQNTSELTLIGVIGRLDLIKIEKVKKIYFGNIVFLVDEIIAKEKNGIIETTLKVQSRTF